MNELFLSYFPKKIQPEAETVLDIFKLLKFSAEISNKKCQEMAFNGW